MGYLLYLFNISLKIDWALPQVTIPAGSIFAAVVNEVASFSLVSCMVTPGFHFQDFELLSQTQLLAEYPQYEQFIRQLAIK